MYLIAHAWKEVNILKTLMTKNMESCFSFQAVHLKHIHGNRCELLNHIAGYKKWRTMGIFFRVPLAAWSSISSQNKPRVCRQHVDSILKHQSVEKGNLKTKLGSDVFTLKWTWKEGNEFSNFWTEDNQSTLNPRLYWQVAKYIIQYIIISLEIWYTSLVREGVFMRTYLSLDTIQQFSHTMPLINNNFPE